MKSRVPYLCLLLLLVCPAACGQVPTSGEGAIAYPPPHTEAAGVSPTPEATRTRSTPPPPRVFVDSPIYYSRCTPTPSESERAAVLALGLPASIDFDLQRAIYLSRQQGIPGRPAAVFVLYDPNVLTLTATVALAGQYGVKVTWQSGRYGGITGEVALEGIPPLATERGITRVGLETMQYIREPSCPTPGGPTPVPITHPPGRPPL